MISENLPEKAKIKPHQKFQLLGPKDGLSDLQGPKVGP